MTCMDANEIAAVLKAHRLWLDGNPDGKKADLHGADLWEADLQGADLRVANLRGADLRVANLRGADLQRADLRVANLRGADLRGADLRDANLRGASLWRADLRGADLRWADLGGAELRDADLRGANLDFSTWPLWCGSLGVVADDRLKIQLLAHVAVLKGELCDPDLAELLGCDQFRRVVQKCHRAAELGLKEGELMPNPKPTFDRILDEMGLPPIEERSLWDRIRRRKKSSGGDRDDR